MTVIDANHREDAKVVYLSIISYFQSVEQEECPFHIWKYTEDENGEWALVKQKYAISSKKFEEIIRSLEKY